jgi:hypothetical protein
LIAAVAETSVWLVVLPVAGALGGVLVGQLLPEMLHRRNVGEARYDAAIAAVARMRSAHHGVGLGIPREYLRAPDAETHAADEHELSKEAFKRFVDSRAEARAALAALHPWSPDLKRFWDKADLGEPDFEPLMGLLTERRASPLARFNDRGEPLHI